MNDLLKAIARFIDRVDSEDVVMVIITITLCGFLLGMSAMLGHLLLQTTP
jgi:hypothetical protein